MKEFLRKYLINRRDAKINLNKKKIKKSISENEKLYYKVLSYGKKNPKKIFYVIQRSPGGGMFSNLNYVLHHLYIAQKLNFIPVVDMENYFTLYNEKTSIKGIKNSWNYYFEPVSKYSLEEVYSSKNVIITDGKTRGNYCFDSFENLNTEHRQIFKKFIKIKKFLIKEKDRFYKKNFINKNILGVHFRGTDYKNRERHPYPATKIQMLNLIHKLNNKYKYDKIFLVTEEKKYLEFLKNEFPNLIYYSKNFTKKNNIFFEKSKKIRYEIGKENIIDMLLLSSLKHIIGVNSNVIAAAKYFSSKNIKIFMINNGYNSKNIFIASFKWYLKKILPKFLGGIDNKRFN